MKKIAFYTTIVLTAFMFLQEVNALAILPYVIAIFLMYEVLFQEKDRSTILGVGSLIMGLLNLLLAFSNVLGFADVVMWSIILLTFGFKKNQEVINSHDNKKSI